ncbi:hypothetical protein NO1_1821 [Candidatus Termititenax aidoneus]|uniref:Uncharacterized protein n=1 Tax=Termititenax aidoneus TaxID=2218524 RepID=A0A388TDV3_TERA1|nr:hypothetical protein NO1_1821 [Candidatus Termititenax aidoneus]
MSTLTDTYEFLHLPDDQRGTHEAQITALIKTCTDIIEKEIGRKISLHEVSGYRLIAGLDYNFYGNAQIYLTGAFRDVLEITAILDNGAALTAGTDYLLHKDTGILKRISGAWSNNVVITGKFGLVVEVIVQDENNEPVTVYEPVPALKQALIEMIAAKSGLWKVNVETEAGTIEQIRTTINKNTQALLNKFRATVV